MNRRDFLAGCGAGLAGAGATACADRREVLPGRPTSPLASGPPALGPAVYIPGYRVADARIGGVAAAAHPAAGRNLPERYDGPLTLLTRLSLDDATVQAAAFPVQGHVVSVSRDRSVGILHAQSHTHMVSFDPVTLDLGQVSQPFADGFVGGGHTEFLADGATFAAAERAPYRPFAGRAQDHHGRITIRAATSLRVIETYSSHGIGPHDLRLLDGGVLMVANYGSTQPSAMGAIDEGTRIVEPSVTLIDLRDGSLVDKLPGTPGGGEIRHASFSPQGTLAAIQVRVGDAAALAAAFGSSGSAALDEADRLENEAGHFLPAAALFRAADGAGWTEAMPDNALQARHGLSIVHDPAGRQFLASYPTSHAVIAFDDQSGAVTHVTDTRRWGLRYPCGLALDPRGDGYMVGGAFADLITFSRARHEPIPDRCYRVAGFQHSHIVVA